MIRFLIALLLVAGCVLGSSCKDVTSSHDVGVSEIEDILDGLCTAFNNRDLDAIMAYYHDDFLHKGRSLALERQTWELRLADYSDMVIEDVSVELDGDQATAGFLLKLSNLSGTETFVEPNENGDLSYFLRDSGEWSVWGNQDPYGANANNLYVSSDPPDARVYLNDAPMFQFTPTVLYDLPADRYRLRLYKEGFNEWETTLDVPGELVVDHTFTTPHKPLPAFNLVQPVDGHHSTSAVASVEGTIRLLNADQTLTDFDGDRCILTVNGVEKVIATTGGVLEYIDLKSGVNEISLRATGSAGNTGTTGTIIVYGEF